MLADNVGALSYGAPTCLFSHSAPMSPRHFCDGATPSSNPNLWTYGGPRATPLHAATFTRPNAYVVGKLSGAVLSTRISHVISAWISSEWLPNVFPEAEVTHKLF